jgi:hypothetical protein
MLFAPRTNSNTRGSMFRCPAPRSRTCSRSAVCTSLSMAVAVAVVAVVAVVVEAVVAVVVVVVVVVVVGWGGPSAACFIATRLCTAPCRLQKT